MPAAGARGRDVDRVCGGVLGKLEAGRLGVVWKDVKLLAWGPKGWNGGRTASDVKIEVPSLVWPVVMRRTGGRGVACVAVFGFVWSDIFVVSLVMTDVNA